MFTIIELYDRRLIANVVLCLTRVYGNLPPKRIYDSLLSFTSKVNDILLVKWNLTFSNLKQYAC